MRSFVPCVRDRSAGDSWSDSRVEPPTKQKFHPTPSRKRATARGTTSGESGAVMQARTSVTAPNRIIRPRPHVSSSRPEMIDGANIPNVCPEMTV